MHPERRRLPRTRTSSPQAVQLRAADAAAVPYNLALRLVDLSDHGACVETSGRLRAGQRVLLELALPGTRLPVKVKGVIRWSKSAPKTGRGGDVAGIQFEQALMASVAAAPPAKDPQRRFRRFVPADLGDARCVAADVWATLGLRRNATRGVRDLSLGGIQLETRRPLRVHQPVRLRLEVRTPRAVIEGEGVVRWCRRDTLSIKPRWTVGIVFRRLHPDTAAALKRVERYYAGPRS